MDLEPLASLHPRFDAQRQLLVLELEHGKANEVGTVELDAFEALCDLVERETAVRTLCTTSRRSSRSGKPIFISGANVTERIGWDDARISAHVERQRRIMQRIRRLPVFHLVLTHGITLGWGTEYLLTGDYVVATKTASFGLPETGLGIIPGARGTAELATLIGPAHALLLGCSGEVVDADRAARMGLVQEVWDTYEGAFERVCAVAEQILRRSPTAVAGFKLALLDGLGQPEHVRLAREGQAYAWMVQSGEAAVGRAHFDAIRRGEIPAWSPRKLAPAGEA